MRFVIFVTALIAVGCARKSQPSPATDRPRQQASQPGFKDLGEFDVVSGKVFVKVGGHATLMAGGAAVGNGAGKIAWDTSRHPDGLVDLALRSASGKEIDHTRVVVLNNGAEVFFKNGSSGTVEVPPTGYRHQHLRYHWDMTGGVKKVLAVLTWDEPGFDLEFALGTGTCPHHGTTAVEKRATSSPIVLSHAASAEQTLSAKQWFAHVRLKNPQAMVGKSTRFSIRAFTTRK